MTDRLEKQISQFYKKNFTPQNNSNEKKKVLNLDKLKQQVQGVKITPGQQESEQFKNEFEESKKLTLDFIDSWQKTENNGSNLVKGESVDNFLTAASLIDDDYKNGYLEERNVYDILKKDTSGKKMRHATEAMFVTAIAGSSGAENNWSWFKVKGDPKKGETETVALNKDNKEKLEKITEDIPIQTAQFQYDNNKLIINVSPANITMAMPMLEKNQKYLQAFLNNNIGSNYSTEVDEKGNLTIQSLDPQKKGKVVIVKDTYGNFTLTASSYLEDSSNMPYELTFNGGKLIASKLTIPPNLANEELIREVMNTLPPDQKVQDRTIDLAIKVLQINKTLTSADVLPSDSDRQLTELNEELRKIRNNFQDYELEMKTAYTYSANGDKTNTQTTMTFKPRGNNSAQTLKICSKEGESCPTMSITTSEDKPSQAAIGK